MPHIVKKITLEEVVAANPETIYYGAISCWWTHDPAHLGRSKSGLPSDPRGGVLFQAEDITGFLKAAAEAPDHYGRHGLDAFMAAHHLNCQRSAEDQRPWCMATWDEYNDAIDASEAN